MRTQVPATGAPHLYNSYTPIVRKFFEFQLASTRVVAFVGYSRPTTRVCPEFKLFSILQRVEIREDHHAEVQRILSNPEPAIAAEVKEVEGNYFNIYHVCLY